MLKILEYKFVTVVLVLVVGWFGLLAWGTWRANTEADRQAADLQARIAAIEQENENLEELRGQYTNPDYLEKEARAKFNYKAPDEKVVYIYKSDDAFYGEVASGIAVPNWKKWAEWLREQLTMDN